MGLFSNLLGGDEWRGKPKEEKQADIIRHKSTKQALAADTERQKRAGTLDENPTYILFNSAVIDSEQHVPWWRW